jgi:hypothetical protein
LHVNFSNKYLKRNLILKYIIFAKTKVFAIFVEIYFLMNVLNINDNPLAFLGDIHGKWEVVKHYFELYSISNINLVQVGDFGVGYKKKDEESQLLNELSLFLKEKNSFLYVIRGNHDNPSYFQKELIDTYTNIILLEDYTVLKNGNHSVLCVGGAVSIDRRLSKERSLIIGRNLWWEGENFNYDEEKLNIILDNHSIDIVVTHYSPKLFYPQGFNHLVMSYAQNDDLLIQDLSNERNLLQNLYDKLFEKTSPKYWFYGHFHNSNREIIDEKINAILLNIDELYYL